MENTRRRVCVECQIMSICCCCCAALQFFLYMWVSFCCFVPSAAADSSFIAENLQQQHKIWIIDKWRKFPRRIRELLITLECSLQNSCSEDSQIWQPLQHLRSATTTFALSIPILYVFDRRLNTQHNTRVVLIHVHACRILFLVLSLAAQQHWNSGLANMPHTRYTFEPRVKRDVTVRRADSDWQFDIENSNLIGG